MYRDNNIFIEDLSRCESLFFFREMDISFDIFFFSLYDMIEIFFGGYIKLQVCNKKDTLLT